MTEKLNIAIVAPNLSGKGGTETVLTKVINHKEYQKKINFKLFLSDGTRFSDWLFFLDVPKENIIVNKRSGFFKQVEKIKFFIKSKDDIILALGPKTVLLAWLIRILFFKKYIIVSWIHFSIQSSPVKRATLLKLADWHLAISKGITNQLINIGVNEKKIYTVFNPVEKSDVTILPSNSSIYNITYIGRMMYGGQKNIHFLIDSLARLNKKNRYVINFFGDGERDELQKIKKYCDDVLSENINVKFHGWVSNPWSEIKSTDVLVLTSSYEGFGMVLAEAISRGIPVVSTNAPVGPSDIIKDGINGFLVGLEDASEFAMTLDYAIQYFKKIDRKIIKESINFLYSENFYKRIENAINDFISKNKQAKK